MAPMARNNVYVIQIITDTEERTMSTERSRTQGRPDKAKVCLGDHNRPDQLSTAVSTIIVLIHMWVYIYSHCTWKAGF